MIILQNNGSKSSMIIYSLERDKKITIVESAELYGVSWSPDQRIEFQKSLYPALQFYVARLFIG